MKWIAQFTFAKLESRWGISQSKTVRYSGSNVWGQTFARVLSAQIGLRYSGARLAPD